MNLTYFVEYGVKEYTCFQSSSNCGLDTQCTGYMMVNEDKFVDNSKDWC